MTINFKFRQDEAGGFTLFRNIFPLWKMFSAKDKRGSEVFINVFENLAVFVTHLMSQYREIQ